ncbi:monocarboxylate transporter 10-like isoform X2 [Homarus americanus]|uniref:monocarboxylate transporter 10-like n=1 Tax=Homarus americanus TaxID=6706 RepID=UPI001C46A260|nr:monocarboxylate transporter 10-like [Homarus americanus]XP_042229595.1 monocarboxylate transporter 10-like [Homarus americanus]XP_042229596.1 monocarboxylate transporter 10-like [Homarus americanus]XP_042229597.1 monocarboxylate transporter 10-like [Homarus americanus]XP_042229604.1 monocarboxylate transporter 10-like isoform X2 [Homarus americanus]
MAITGEGEEPMVEEGAQSVIIPTRNTSQAEDSVDVPSPGSNDTPMTEMSAIENGHVQLMVADEPTLAEKVAMENYDVPAHVLAFVPPDGGCRAWLVMFASFLCNGIIFGTINSSGLLYADLVKKLQDAGDPNAAFKTSMMTSLAIGSTFLLSVVAGVLTDNLGIRLTTFIGGALATAGMFISSFFCDQVEILMITYGLMFGGGASLAYTPSLVILGHYFQRWMGLVNGFVTAGSSVFTIALPFILPHVLDIGLQTTFQVLAGLNAFLMLAALVFKPLMPILPQARPQYDNTCKGHCLSFWSRIINFDIWLNKRYVIWTLCIPSALFGYFVPYVHMVKYAKNVLGEDANSQLLVQCMGITSGLGRIFFGLIADRPWVNRIILQQISFFCIGVLTMLLTAANAMPFFIVITLGMGLFDGCFISLLGPIAFDIVGPVGASQAIGCLLAMCSIPLTSGPAIAGALYDHLQSYLIPFLCAGIPPIVGAFVLFSISCIKQPPKGAPGSPVREPTEKQNNAAAVEEPKETHKLMSDYRISNGDISEPRPLSTSTSDDAVKVDVRRLATLQRESCV